MSYSLSVCNVLLRNNFTYAEHTLVDTEEKSRDSVRAGRRLGENSLQTKISQVANVSDTLSVFIVRYHCDANSLGTSIRKCK